MSRVDAHTLALARAARDEATALAKRCWLYSSYDDNAVRYRAVCSWGDSELEPLRKASSALVAAAPDAGDAVVFIEHVRLFREWIDLSGGSYSGALAHYQDLALAWNSFQPQDRIPIDAYAPESRDHPPPDAGPFTWQRCASGPCLVILER